MGDTINKELEFLPWSKKVLERLQVFHTCILDKRKIMDSDYDVMEELFRVYNEGRIPFYQRVAGGESQNVLQADLFTDRSSDKF